MGSRSGRDGRGLPESHISIVIYGIHPVIIGGTLHSADHLATPVAEFRKSSGHLVIFLIAACGNINHVDRSRHDQPNGVEKSRRIGRTIAAGTLVAFGKAEPADGLAVKLAFRIVPSRLRIVPESDVKKACRLEKEKPKKAAAFSALCAPAAILLGRTKDRDHPARIMALGLGPVGFVGMPGKIFVLLARKVRHDGPLVIVRTIGLSNGGIGYFPTAEALTQRGNKTGYRSARYRPEPGHDWARAGVKLSRGLVRGYHSG